MACLFSGIALAVVRIGFLAVLLRPVDTLFVALTLRRDGDFNHSLRAAHRVERRRSTLSAARGTPDAASRLTTTNPAMVTDNAAGNSVANTKS
ncbi:MAG: hypothetical protein ACREB5_11245 [Sphingomonadaceae bacterium]